MSTRVTAVAIVKILKKSKGPLRSAEIRRALDCPPQQVYNALAQLQHDGTVVTVGTRSRLAYELAER
jgi:DNA-binding IclR family transcriptional regulator